MIIGLSGKAQVGKDTVCMIMQLLYPNDRIATEVDDIDAYASFPSFFQQSFKFISKYKNKKFAFKVKEVASLLTGIATLQFEDEEFKNSPLGDEWKVKRLPDLLRGPRGSDAHYEYFYSPLTVRELLQRIGTEAMRKGVHEDVWVNSLIAEYKHNNLFQDHFVISDVRFPNEVAAIKKEGGLVIRINRPSLKEKMYSTHESEIALDNYKDWDYVIDNLDGIPELIVKVREMMEKLNLPR